jgi:ankyrin repeat domain-containing protein 50
MSDPLSIAGGAVGVISLGIQVIQGLVTYLQEWKSQDADIATTVLHLEDLKRTLEHLNSVLNDSNMPTENTGLLQHLEQLARRVEGGIDELQAALSKFRKNAPSEEKLARIKVVFRSFQYPFKKDVLKSLINTVRDMRLNLSTALQILNL